MKKLLKIAFTGPECSGKTTLAQWLSKQWDCHWSPEFARAYLSSKMNYAKTDLDEIAMGQFISNQQVPVSDTEMLVMDVWSRVKYGHVSQKITELLSTQNFDLYFLCKPDFPWEEDPLRENPTDREQLFERYVQRLKELNWNYHILEGSLDERKRKIQEVLENEKMKE